MSAMTTRPLYENRNRDGATNACSACHNSYFIPESHRKTSVLLSIEWATGAALGRSLDRQPLLRVSYP